MKYAKLFGAIVASLRLLTPRLLSLPVAFGLMAAGIADAAEMGTPLMLIGPNSNVAQKAKIVGSQLMLVGPNSNVAEKFAPAARGTYTQQDGTKLVVGDNGLIVERKHIGHPK